MHRRRTAARSATGLLALAATIGCARPNPDFGDDGSTLTTSTTSSGTSGTTLDPTTGPGDGPGDGPVDGSSGGATGSESSGGDTVCELHDFSRITFAPLDWQEMPIEVPNESGCNGGLDTFGEYWVDGGSLLIVECEACGCKGDPDFEIDLGGSVALPPGFAGCGAVFLWEGTASGACDWDGLLVHPMDQPVPELVLANSRSIPYPPFAPVGMADDMLCELPACDGLSPGRHALAFADGSVITVSNPDLADLGTGHLYEVVNKMSSITPGCQEQVAWWAHR